MGLLVAEAARELKRLRAVPFAGACTDPCDGRTQGTTGMMDSLPFRNDAAQVFRRLIRSLPTRTGVLGVATCDKGLPAMMMALASSGKNAGGSGARGRTLLPESGEDAGRAQTIGARFAQKQITLEYAAEVGCRACASPGGGCQFLGTAWPRRRWWERRSDWRFRTQRLPRQGKMCGWMLRGARRVH